MIEAFTINYLIKQLQLQRIFFIKLTILLISKMEKASIVLLQDKKLKVTEIFTQKQ